MSHFKFLNFGIFRQTDLSGNTVWPQATGFQKLAKMDNFWLFELTFVHSICKRSSLRSQCWMRLFLWFSNTVALPSFLLLYKPPARNVLAVFGWLQLLYSLGGFTYLWYVSQVSSVSICVNDVNEACVRPRQPRGWGHVQIVPGIRNVIEKKRTCRVHGGNTIELETSTRL